MGYNESGKWISEPELCNDVAKAANAVNFQPSVHASMPMTDPDFTNTGQLYTAVLAQTLANTTTLTFHATADGALEVFNQNKEAWAATAFATIKATVDGGGGKTVMDGARLAAMQLYNNPIPSAYGSIAAGGESLLHLQVSDEAVAFITKSVLRAIGAGTSGWLPAALNPSGQGNLVAWGYQEIAACAATNLAMTPAAYSKGKYVEAGVFNDANYDASMTAIDAAEDAIAGALVAGLGASSVADALAQTLAIVTPSAPPPSWYASRGCPATADEAAAADADAADAAAAAAAAASTPALQAAGLAGVVEYFEAGGNCPGTTINADVIGAFGPAVTVTAQQVGGGVAAAVVLQFTNPSALAHEAAAAFVVGLGVDTITDAERTDLTLALGAALLTLADTGSPTAAGTAYFTTLMSSGGSPYATKFGKYLAPTLSALATPGNLPAITAFSTAFGSAAIRNLLLTSNYAQLHMLMVVPTVNFKARPLPRKWGIDRFPCTSPSLLEIFREGDYAYPYALKQLSEISTPVYGYMLGAAALGLEDCVDKAVVQLGVDAAYGGTIQMDYTATAAPSRVQAECAFARAMEASLPGRPVEEAIAAAASPLHASSAQEAGVAAVVAYLANGGSVSDVSATIAAGAENASMAGNIPVVLVLGTIPATFTDPVTNQTIIAVLQAAEAAGNAAVGTTQTASAMTEQQLGAGFVGMLQHGLANSAALKRGPPSLELTVSLAMAFVEGTDPTSTLDPVLTAALESAFNASFPLVADPAVAGGTYATTLLAELAGAAAAFPTAHIYFSLASTAFAPFGNVLTASRINNPGYVPPTTPQIGNGLAQMLLAALQLFAVDPDLDAAALTGDQYAALAVAAIRGKGADITPAATPALTAAYAAALPLALACLPTAAICSTGGPAASPMIADLDVCARNDACLLTAAVTFATVLGTGGGSAALLAHGSDFATVSAMLGAIPTLVPFALNFGTGVGGALYLEVAAGEQLNYLGSALLAFGYRYRPTYGTHRTNWILNSTSANVAPFKALYNSIPTEPVVEVRDAVGDALRAYYEDTDNSTEGSQQISVLACIRTKSFADGAPLRGCLLSWAASFIAPDLLLAEATTTTPGKDFHQGDPAGISFLRYQRVTVINWAPDNLAQLAAMSEYMNTTLDPDTLREISYKYEGALTDWLEPLWAGDAGSGFGPGEAHGGEHLSFATDRGTSDVVRDATAVEWGNLVICYVVMILVIALSMTSFSSNVESHFFLGIAGVLVIAASVLATLGASTWWFGVKFTPVASNVAPFIALGIGIDDMLVVAKAFQLHCTAGSDVQTILRETMAEAGPSITFTTLTNLAAFLVATATPINVVRWFAEIMAISVVMNWVFLWLMFVPIMCLDARRVLRDAPEFCCPHSDSMNRFTITTFMEKYYAPFLMWNPVRIAVLFIFATFFGVQLWQAATKAQVGIRNTDIMMEDTYQHELYFINEENFLMYPCTVVTRSDSFDDPRVQLDLMMTAKNLAASDWIESYSSGAANTWVASVIGSLPAPRRTPAENPPVPSGCTGDATFDTNATYETLSGTDFYDAFSVFLQGTGALQAGGFACKNTTSDAVTSCFGIIPAYAAGGAQDVVLTGATMGFYLNNQHVTSDFLDAIVDTRERVDACKSSEANHWTYAFGYTYKYWEQYLHSWDDLVEVVGYSMLGVIAITFLFQFSLRSSLTLAVVIAMVVVELAGYIPEHGRLKLNAFSIVNIAISVGMAIEFTAHIVHQFLAEPGTDKKDRVIRALGYMGEPMFFGMLSSLISSAFLAFSATEFIRQYYFAMFFVMIVIASVNGLVLLPVLLSFVGDSPMIGAVGGTARASAVTDGFGFDKKKEEGAAQSGDNYLEVGGDGNAVTGF